MVNIKMYLIFLLAATAASLIMVIGTIPQDEYDFIVVGAGSAGAVVASRLTEIPSIRVLLLEAGADQFQSEPYILSEIPAFSQRLPATAFDWKYVSVPQSGSFLSRFQQRVNLTRGKALGGSSRVNTMVYVRGSRHDFDRWAAQGNPGWTYDEVLPFFLKSEDNANMAKSKYHNSGGPLTVSNNNYRSRLVEPFLQSAVANGFTLGDVNGESQMHFMSIQGTTRNGRRWHTGKAFLWPANNRSNLNIVQDALVQKVMFDDRKSAYGVEYVRHGVKRVARASKEIILSAGVFGSAQLLILSGVGPEDQLEQFKIKPVAILPGVGQNSMDHIGIMLRFTTNNTKVSVCSGQPQGPDSLTQWVSSGTGFLSTLSGVEATGFFKTTPPATDKPDWPDAQMFLLTTSEQDVFTILPCILHPKSRGTVRLQSSDPKVQPLIDPKYFSHPDDIKVAISSIKQALSISGADPLKPFGVQLDLSSKPGCENFTLLSDQHLECLLRRFTITIDHTVGTCKMGPDSDSQAVVDAQLRVRKVQRLRVVDASIMPFVTGGNTNAPTIMIGEKASNMIKAAHKLPV